MSAVLPDLFNPPASGPDGLRHQLELITPAEEQALVTAIRPLPFKPFDFHGHQGNRRVVAFGFRYDYNRALVQPSKPLPDVLRPLRDRAAAFAGLQADDLQQAMVTEYAPGAGIGWHRDKPQFGEVLGVSLLSPCTLRLRRKAGPRWERFALPLPPRSIYLLSGEARTVWEHSIVPLQVLRYSITFRRYLPTG